MPQCAILAPAKRAIINPDRLRVYIDVYTHERRKLIEPQNLIIFISTLQRSNQCSLLTKLFK